MCAAGPLWALALALALHVALCSGGSSVLGSGGGSSGREAAEEPLPPPDPPTAAPRCISTGGRAVDWWVLLKFPQGEAAVLLDSDDVPLADGGGGGGGGGEPDGKGATPCWRGGWGVNDQDSPLRATLGAAGVAAAAAVRPRHVGGRAAAAAEGMQRRNRRTLQAWGPAATAPGVLAAAAADADAAETPPLGYAFYNDADPEGVEHWGFAHAKGALIFGSEGGVWLTHSFPRYPGRPPRGAGGAGAGSTTHSSEQGRARRQTPGGPAGAAGGNASSGWDAVQRGQTVFGQHALCLSLPADQLARVAAGLLVARAYVYDSVLPDALAEPYSNVQKLVEASRAPAEAEQQLLRHHGRAGAVEGSVLPPPVPPEVANTSVLALRTAGGGVWLHVTKSPNHTEPFHEEVLEPLLGEAMAWETWRVGPSYPSECPPETLYGSFNVRRVELAYCAGSSRTGGHLPREGASGGGGGVHSQLRWHVGATGAAGWDSLKDHSKWGISADGVVPSSRAMGAAGAGGPGRHESTRSSGGVVGSGHRVCLGDLNRQPSQIVRGGGYACSAMGPLWRAFRSLVSEVEQCGGGSGGGAAEVPAPSVL